MNHWLDVAYGLADDENAVVVSVAAVKGSSPREAGTKMIVFKDRFEGTIGGGKLEHETIAVARTMMLKAREDPYPRLKRYSLGTDMGQCCGGVVDILFEPIDEFARKWVSWARHRSSNEIQVVTLCGESGKWLNDEADVFGLQDEGSDTRVWMDGIRQQAEGKLSTVKQVRTPDNRESMAVIERWIPPDFIIVLFGAGHVGRALVPILAGLPCRILWIDERADQFPEQVPANVEVRVSRSPEVEIDMVSPGAYYLVMTHSHSLDEAICEYLLGRGGFSYCGLIGSMSKRRSFEKRWRRRGLSESAISTLTCPIGLKDIHAGKHPTEIAISVAAQILAIRDSLTSGDASSEVMSDPS